MVKSDLYKIYLFLKKIKIAQNPRFQAIFGGADDRGRTGTGIASHGILSPGRLPVPPHRQMLFTTYGIIS